MPKGIKKTTTATLRADIDKQMAAIKAKEIALAKAKDDYDKKGQTAEGRDCGS